MNSFHHGNHNLYAKLVNVILFSIWWEKVRFNQILWLKLKADGEEFDDQDAEEWRDSDEDEDDE